MVPPPPPPSSPITSTSDAAATTHSRGASPLFYLARFAMALAPSALVMVGAGTLTPVLFAPVEAVHAAAAAAAAAPAAGADEVGTDTDFKVSKRVAKGGKRGREGRKEVALARFLHLLSCHQTLSFVAS